MSAVHDINGNESSKRKLGMRLLNTGIFMGVAHWMVGTIAAFTGRVFEYEFPFGIWWTIMGTGASLLGITLVERFGKK